MVATSVKFGSLLSFLAVLLALFYRGEDEYFLNERISSVSDGLLRLENKYIVPDGNLQPKVVVGYGACHDLFVDALALLDYAKLEGEPEHFDDISNFLELYKSFAFYYKHGAAAERYSSNETFFDELVAHVSKSFDTKWALGGNAPVMATRFYLEGCNVLLAAKMTDKLKQYIPEDIHVVGGDKVAKDDIHLILEYKAEDRWGPFTAPRANRYILHNDENNPMISSLEYLDKHLTDFKANLFVVSGLQMLDNYPFKQGVREKRLNLVKQQMLSLPKETLIHFEMASYVELKLLENLIELIIPHADSVGMNEQELANLYNMFMFGNVSIVTDSNPRVAMALDQMREIFKLVSYRDAKTENSRPITRIHVHTLAYQAIMTVKGSKWKQTKAAAAKASLTAHRHVCGSKSILLEKTKLVMDDSFATTTAKRDAFRIVLDPLQPVSCWDETLDIGTNVEVEICVAPVLVCTQAHQTAGAGDNISAAGLVLQI